ncbi:hypothetical protein BGZ96_000172 [Linnemannia gamsii]|uniref:Uncharacterized protein n=1 Tax=Linnemannia gamsii TaxID=64522 RepID=A0ABQ7JPT6_9FUNG|nr:hypothetical protein BGZ96_000172 [Linnemannia gamsii]
MGDVDTSKYGTRECIFGVNVLGFFKRAPLSTTPRSYRNRRQDVQDVEHRPWANHMSLDETQTEALEKMPMKGRDSEDKDEEDACRLEAIYKHK